jgi:peptidoglycan/LPS O-acetylase OafA/YrhL
VGYIPALDGLRGIAIAIVVAYHAFGQPRGGWLGVDLFFVLSGFLITRLLLLERPIRLRAFYARRARRLLPALLALLAGYLVLGGGLAAVARYGLYSGNAYEAFRPGASLQLNGLNHLWSLAQEEQFYLVWPAALLAVRRLRRPAVVLASLAVTLIGYRALLAATGAGDARVYFAPDTNVDGLLLGAALGFRSPQVSRRLVRTATVLAAGAVALVSSTAVLDAWTIPLFELSAVVLVAAAVAGTLHLPGVLVRLGRISYSLYLWHFVVLWALHWRHPLLAVVLSVAVAAASTRWVERPFRRRRLEPLLGRPVVARVVGVAGVDGAG